MEVKNLCQRGNTLQATFMVKPVHYDKLYATESSPKYIISGAAVFQLKIITVAVRSTYIDKYSSKYYHKKDIFIRFVELYQGDDPNYAIKFTSNDLGIVNKNFISNDGSWHLIYENENPRGSFDVTVYMDKVPSASSFAMLHEDTELTDFELRGEDGSVRLHRTVLAAVSPVFRRMLSGKWREAAEGHVEVPSTTRETLHHFKDYVYLHALPDNGLEQLLLLASYYLIQDLEKKCVHKLVISLTAENACNLLLFAGKHEMTHLLLGILECIQSGRVKLEEMRDHYLQSKSSISKPPTIED